MKRQRTKPHPSLVILSLEEFAGEVDPPCNEPLARLETAELQAVPGGKYTYAMFIAKPRGRAVLYEQEGLRLRAKAMAAIP